MSHSAANWIMEDKQGQKRKYVLFKKEGADSGPKQCAFFSSDAGCRNSSSCMFVHCKDGKTYPTKAGSAAPKAAPIVALSEPSIPVTSAVAPTSHKKAKVVSTSSVPSAESTPVTKGSKQQAAEDEDSSLLFGAVNVALNGYTPVSASLRRGPPLADKKTATIEVLGHQHTQQILLTSGTTHATLGAKSLQKNLKNKFDSVAAGSAVEFEKPVGTTAGPGVARPLAPAISAPKGAAPTHEAVQPIDDGDEKKLLREALSLVSAVKAGSAVAKPKTLAETIHPDAVDWAPLVELTRASPKYEKDYLTQTDLQGWCSSQLGNREGHAVLAMDCEMCSTIDPVTNLRNSMQLIRFSLISENEVLVDSLVNPELPIAEMRTNIHGITEEEVTKVQFTLRHAQAIMKAYCGEGTVIVGHALYNDLRSLKFNHSVVVDTSYLYSIENEPGQAPSIRDISEAVLNVSMDTIHDSVLDAKASLNAAQHVLRNGTHVPIPRSASSTARQLSTGLMIHRIPQGCEERSLSDMMVKLCAVMPTLVQPIQWSRDGSGAENGKTMIFFPSKEHADLAFDGLPGPNRPDKSNRPQKRAYLKGGGYMCIRKNYA